MKNYFFATDEARKSKLREAGINFYDLEVDGVAGVILEAEQIIQALQIIGAQVETEKPSSLEGILSLTLLFEPSETTQEEATSISKYKIEVANWNGRNRERFVAVAKEILLPVVKRDIIFHVPHNENFSPQNDRKFHIFIWSSPDGQSIQRSPETIWGISVDCRDNGFLASRRGIEIEDEETGWDVGELVENNLYIHHDLCHHGTDQEIEIFRRLCKEAVEKISLTPAEKKKLQRISREKMQQISRNAYIRECTRRYTETLRHIEEVVLRGEVEIADLQKELVRSIREVIEAKRMLEQLNNGSVNEIYGKEFDKLLTIEKIHDVSVTNGIINIYTNSLQCLDPRTGILHQIGKFRIELFTEKGYVRWHNLSQKIDGYRAKMNAPHVFPDGKACLGNIEEIIPDLMGNYEYSALAMVAIQFIESVNVDDSAGKYIDRWPVSPVKAKK